MDEKDKMYVMSGTVPNTEGAAQQLGSFEEMVESLAAVKGSKYMKMAVVMTNTMTMLIPTSMKAYSDLTTPEAVKFGAAFDTFIYASAAMLLEVLDDSVKTEDQLAKEVAAFMKDVESLMDQSMRIMKGA
ncbi:hypothetical protein Tiera_032 [Polaromonas phage Tiera]|nr:hypothetical protein Tiera_032 [Polaromonas phage Tiera]